MYDKIANDADWQDGMNAFRASIIKQLEEIKQIIKGEPQ